MNPIETPRKHTTLFSWIGKFTTGGGEAEPRPWDGRSTNWKGNNSGHFDPNPIQGRNRYQRIRLKRREVVQFVYEVATSACFVGAPPRAPVAAAVAPPEHGAPIAATVRSMHGNGEDPAFTHDDWLSLRNDLRFSGDPVDKAMGALMNKMQHYYFEAADMGVRAQGRVFAEAACVKLLNLTGSLSDNHLELPAALAQIETPFLGPASLLARSPGPLGPPFPNPPAGPLRILHDAGKSGSHFSPSNRMRRMFKDRKAVVKAAYQVAAHFSTVVVGAVGAARPSPPPAPPVVALPPPPPVPAAPPAASSRLPWRGNCQLRGVDGTRRGVLLPIHSSSGCAHRCWPAA